LSLEAKGNVRYQTFPLEAKQNVRYQTFLTHALCARPGEIVIVCAGERAQPLCLLAASERDWRDLAEKAHTCQPKMAKEAAPHSAISRMDRKSK
jgi:hypothetical protein